MYSSGQVIYDTKNKKPVKLGYMWSMYDDKLPPKNIHFELTDKGAIEYRKEYASPIIRKHIKAGDVNDPGTVEKAIDWLERGLIVPGKR